jgi:hypothetical protein
MNATSCQGWLSFIFSPYDWSQRGMLFLFLSEPISTEQQNKAANRPLPCVFGAENEQIVIESRTHTRFPKAVQPSLTHEPGIVEPQ